MTYRQLLAANADFRRLWTGQVISEVGDWLNNIAVLAFVIQLAGEGAAGWAVAVYAVARHLPLFLFGPVAGVVVDRVDRRRVMIAADLARALLALGFALAHRFESLAVIYVVGSLLFSVSAFFNAAKRAAIPNLVLSTEELLTANSLSASTTAATIAAGSALGGVAAAFLGRDAVFLLNALTFLASAEMIRRIRSETRKQKAEGRRQRAEGGEPEAADIRLEAEAVGTDLKFEISNQRVEETTPPGRAPTAFCLLPSAFCFLPSAFSALRRVVAEFREGLQYVRRDSLLWAVFVVAGGWGLGNGAARALYSVFGARLGEQTASAFVARPTDFGISVLFVAMGLGGVLGAPLARRFNRAGGRGLGARMGRSMVLDGLGLAVFSQLPNLWAAAAVLVAREMNFAVWWTAQQTMLMRRTDDRFAGRVFATYETLTTLAMLGSMLLAGAAADRLGRGAVAFAAGIVITSSGLLWFALRRNEEGEKGKRENG